MKVYAVKYLKAAVLRPVMALPRSSLLPKIVNLGVLGMGRDGFLQGECHQQRGWSQV